MRLLLTEDDPQLGRATQIGLEQNGYAVDWVLSAEHALTAARLHDYGCILLDIGLPGQDGMQALHLLRDSGYTGAVLMVTARDQVPDRIAGLDAGADDFLIKPFDLDELAARIRSACRRAAGRVREQLEKNLYSWGGEVESNAVQVHIHHLRKKLGRDLIRTVHAIGYCIDKPKAA